MSDHSFDIAQKALRNRAVVDLEEPLPDEQPTRWWLRIVVLLVFFVFGAIVWLSWRDNAGDGEPVLVEAPPGPIKEKPLDPGGMTSPNADTQIPSTLANDGAAAKSTAEPRVGPASVSAPPIRPKDEELLPPDTSVAKAEESVPTSGLAQESADVGTTEDADKAAVVASDEDDTTPDESVAPSAGPQPLDAPLRTADAGDLTSRPLAPLPVAPEAPAVEVPKLPSPPSTGGLTVAKPVPAVEPTPPRASAPPKPPAPVASEPAQPRVIVPQVASIPAPKPNSPPARQAPPDVNTVRIQIGSLRDQVAANTAWERAAEQNPDVFDGKRRLIVPADVRGTTYYRAQLAGFPTQEAAKTACSKIQGNGGDCLVVAR